MLLSSTAIKRHLKKGNIIISPFREKNLGNCSYDLTLGKFYYREKHPDENRAIYNMYSQEDVYRVWGKNYETAKPLKKLIKGINANDLVIWLAPGETILGHTEEFIGGKDVVTTMMKARSSIGRNFITVCRCAGWGDVGYINRWAMTITNNSRFYHIPLVAGRRVAQMVFFEVEPIQSDSGQAEQKNNQGAYHTKEDTKYQKSIDLKKLRKDWQPDDLLPKAWQDREIRPIS